MDAIVYDRPLFIEELVFQVKPELVEHYLDLEKEIFSAPLAEMPGFRGAETWVSGDRPGVVSSFYFWESEEAYHNLDQAWLNGQKAKMDREMGAEDLRFLAAGHTVERRFKAREYR